MAVLDTLKLRWSRLAPREKRAVRLAAFLVGVALVWSVLLSPALGVLKRAQSQRAALDAELESMQKLQLRARVLQSQSVLSPQDSLTALQRVSAMLGGNAKWTVAGGQATLSLQKVPAPLLAQWFAQSGTQGTVPPVQAHLVRDGAAAEVTWSGTMLYSLPSDTAR
jgi:general secretion pathway protein M